MSIFKRHEQGGVDQKTATPPVEARAQSGRPEQQGKLMPPFTTPAAAAGVVPPPATPTYSMRPPTPRSAPPIEPDVERSTYGNGSFATEHQQRAQASVEGALRVSMQRASSTTSSNGARSRPAPRSTRTLPPSAPQPHHAFDALAYAQIGLLHLAWSWQEAGSPIRAIHAYMELLARYPGTPAADAAVADLVELSGKLAQQGNFHLALGIYDELAHLQHECEEG